MSFRPSTWSYVALVLAAAGVILATWFVFATPTEPAHVNWPLVFAPVAVASVPVLLPRTGTRLGAMLGMGASCFVTGFSIGFLLLPSLAALVVASLRETG